MRFVIGFDEQFSPWGRWGTNMFPLEVPGISLGALGVKPRCPLSVWFSLPRFLFVLLGPGGKAHQYHEIGRSMATTMTDEV